MQNYIRSQEKLFVDEPTITRATTTMNTATNPITILMLVCPKEIHALMKSFVELLLDLAQSPFLDASAPGTSGKQIIAREAEVITSADAWRGLEQIENDKKEKFENKKQKVKKNML